MTTLSDSLLLIALPTGRMAEEILALFQQAGLSTPTGNPGRKLILPSADNALRYIMAKPTDMPTFVEYGAADIGICGLNTLREGGCNVYEPLLLPMGRCRLSLIGPAERPDTPLRYASQPRVATKYPHLTAEFFRGRGVNAEIIKRNGSIELAPLVGLVELIVDLIETGNTMRANGLVELRVIMHSQAVLIVNRAAHRLKATAIQHILGALRAILTPAMPDSEA